MDREELLEARGRLEAFLELLLPLLGRSERCRWGAFYIQGLLLEGGRKTAAGMAAHFGGNVQAVQQFVNQSPWDWLAVRRALAQDHGKADFRSRRLDLGRHRLSQKGDAFRGRGPAILRHLGQDWQLPGGGKSELCH